MLDKFKKWLFTEESDEEILDEPELLDEHYEEDAFEIPAYEEKVSTYKEVKEVVERENKVVIEPSLPTQEPSKQKKVIDIKADEPLKKEEPAKLNTSRILQRRDDFEMPQVISPYFGVKDEANTEDHPTHLSPVSASKKETFNSVISPFYGKKDSKPIMQERAKKSETIEIKSIEPTPISFLQANEVLEEAPEEEVNIALDEIISNKQEEADDLIQFSLFGGSEKVQKSDFENEEWDQENDENDTLPF